jgi:CPA2 family monovalent cation:H+ antiporter-2
LLFNPLQEIMATQAQDVSQILLELGAAIVGLAVLARLANRLGFSAIPLYLLAGLAFGKGGLAPLNFSEHFTHTGAEIGLLLLLFMLGLEYTEQDLKQNLQVGLPAGIVDLLLNFTPGLLAGLLMGWRTLPSVLLGGVTYISSSGIIAKLLAELKWLNNPEMPAVIRSRLRAGVELVARGEFSIAIAGMGVALEPRLGPLAACYVLFLAVLGPVLARFAK